MMPVVECGGVVWCCIVCREGCGGGVVCGGLWCVGVGTGEKWKRRERRELRGKGRRR